MHERIIKRLAELRQAQKQRETELIVLNNLIAELERLLEPEPIFTHGEDAPQE